MSSSGGASYTGGHFVRASSLRAPALRSAVRRAILVAVQGYMKRKWGGELVAVAPAQ